MVCFLPHVRNGSTPTKVALIHLHQPHHQLFPMLSRRASCKTTICHFASMHLHQWRFSHAGADIINLNDEELDGPEEIILLVLFNFICLPMVDMHLSASWRSKNAPINGETQSGNFIGLEISRLSSDNFP
ncbi:hypothetical protein BS78_01G135100 [Paspalum vaginatum]|nr:hypothetical protein BS78_01G135100 [Paspalum vaginatum]